MELTFLTGSCDGALRCLSVNITSDGAALEGDETFIVTLTTTDTVTLGESMTTITIIDESM